MVLCRVSAAERLAIRAFGWTGGLERGLRPFEAGSDPRPFRAPTGCSLYRSPERSECRSVTTLHGYDVALSEGDSSLGQPVLDSLRFAQAPARRARRLVPRRVGGFAGRGRWRRDFRRSGRSFIITGSTSTASGPPMRPPSPD
jgi:hypothetical protein